MSNERRLEINRSKKLLYNQIRDLQAEKNRIEMEVSTLMTEYQALDRELAEMNITYCAPTESGIKKVKPVKLSMDQVRVLAARLGVNLED